MKKRSMPSVSNLQLIMEHELVDAVSDGIIVQDTNYRIIRQNKIQNEAYGDHIGEYCYKAYENRDTICEWCPVRKTFRDGKVHKTERRIKRGENTYYYELTSSPLYDPKGKIIAAVKSVRDITKLRGDENALRESEKRFRNLIETTSDWVWEVDKKGTYTYASPRVRDILGYGPDEVIGKTPFDLMPPDEADRLSSYFRKVVRSKQPINLLENRNLHKNGREVILETSAIPVFDDKGSLTGYRGIDRDITQQKKVRDELMQRMKLAELSADIGRTLAENLSIRNTLQRCSESLLKLLDVSFVRIWTFNKAQKVLELKGSAGLYTHIDGAHGRIPLGSFKVGMIAKTRKPHITNNVIGDKYIHDQMWVKKQGIVAFAGYPLVMKDSLEGVMAIFSKKPLNEIIMKALSSAAHIIALGVRRKEAEDELWNYQSHLEQLISERTDNLSSTNKKLLKEISDRKILEKLLINIEERERRRIGRDLHDGLGQLLTGLAFKARGLGRKLEKKDIDEAEDSAELSILIDEAKEQLSRITRGLHPVEIDSEGLMRALEELAFFTSKVFGINCSFICQRPVNIRNRSATPQLYRIAQEAVNNAVKHGSPSSINISLEKKYNKVKMVIRDNGKGFRDIPQKSGGMGLKIMTYRASLINASLDVRKDQKSGALVVCIFSDRIKEKSVTDEAEN